MLQRALALVCGFILLTSALLAQTGVGQVQGTVNDTSGAVLPNIPVVIENVSTHSKFQTTTSDAGFFVFPALRPASIVSKQMLLACASGKDRSH